MGGSREWGKRLRRARPQARAVIEWNDKAAPVQLNEEAAPVQPVQKGKDNMKSITTGDIMHAMGSSQDAAPLSVSFAADVPE